MASQTPRNLLSLALLTATFAACTGKGATGAGGDDGTGQGTGSGPGDGSGSAAQLAVTDDGGHAVSELTFSDADTAMVHVANTSTVASKPLTLSFTGDASADFGLDTASCAQLALAPGDHCDIVVRYQPVTADPATARLAITDSAGATSQVDLRPVVRPGVLIKITGGATGDVLVDIPLDGTLFGTCTATTNHDTACLLRIAGGQAVEVVAATPSQYGGLAGACSSTTTRCSFTVGTGISTITATFTTIAGEQWSRLLGGKRIMSAAYDSANNLIVASDSVTKLSPSGATVWQLAVPACAVATGPGNTIYVETTTDLQKLAPDGTKLWSQPLDPNAIGCGNTDDGFDGFVHNLAVGSDGAVAIHGNTGAARWDTNGNLTWSIAVSSLNEFGVAIDPQGNVDVGVQDNDDEDIDLAVFSPAGDPLTTQLGISGSYHGMFISDATGRVLSASSGHSEAIALGHFVHIPDPDFAPTGIAEAGTGDLAWLYETDDTTSFGRDWVLNRYHPDGSVASTFHNATLANPPDEPLGTSPHDIAASPDGHIAIVGDFFGAAYNASWIITLSP